MKPSQAVTAAIALLLLVAAAQMLVSTSSIGSSSLGLRQGDQHPPLFEWVQPAEVCRDFNNVDDLIKAVENNVPCIRPIRDMFLDIEVSSWSTSAHVQLTVLSKQQERLIKQTLRKWHKIMFACRMMINCIQDAIFQVKNGSDLRIPFGFRAKLLGWLGGSLDLEERVRHDQKVLHVYNRRTKTTTAFNPLRSKRPLPKSDRDPKKFIQETLERTE